MRAKYTGERAAKDILSPCSKPGIQVGAETMIK